MFIPSLGVELKFVHGNPKQHIPKCISMSVFHLYIEDNFVQHVYYYKYIQYLLLSVMYASQNNKDWVIRLYTDDSIISHKNKESEHWRRVMHIFRQLDNVQIINIKFPNYYNEDLKCHKGLLGAMFRFLPLFDSKVDICIFRDIDNIWTGHDFYFVNQWIESSARGMLYLDYNYRKQEISELTPTDVIRTGPDTLSIFAGVWGFKGTITETWWHKMFYYIEQTNAFVYSPKYKGYKFYQIPFIYGFDELVLSKVLMPALMQQDDFYVVPIQIWNTFSFSRLFDSTTKTFHKQIGLVGKIREDMQYLFVHKYWDMESSQSGLAQFLLGLLSTLYCRVITEDTRFNEYKDTLKKIYPIPFLIAIGSYYFKNVLKYRWHYAEIVIKNILFNEKYKAPWKSLLQL